MKQCKIRRLVIVLGDQLNHDSAALRDFKNASDAVWMAENDEEATHVWSHQSRLVGFFSPMRHFRDELRAAGRRVLYHELTSDRRVAAHSSFASLLDKTLLEYPVSEVVVVRPGDYRVKESLSDVVERHDLKLQVLPDEHFYCTPERFASWAQGRKSLVLEQFYHVMRRDHAVLMDDDGQPAGGQWNYDHENRGTFGKKGPGAIPAPVAFSPDAITRDVMKMVETRFGDHPGNLQAFDLPVCRADAMEYLKDFIRHRLPFFGQFQDAMWQGETYLYHSRLSHAINLHMLSPREVVDAAIDAWRNDAAPLAAVEGFTRQILGWREYVRGIYWLKMPQYATRNSLACDEGADVPSCFWDGKTEMACVADAMRLLIDTGYAHHIQRLMVLGLYAQLVGTHPFKFHEWHMAMYADAVDWVSLPNALGMSQHGDGGLMATKPYCASGSYINRMSNHCRGCRYDPKKAIGEDACPFTTLYWDFLDRHRDEFRKNTRMVLQIKNLERKPPGELAAIRARAETLRTRQAD